MTSRRLSPTRDHDLRMHLGVILMALQMITRPPTTPLQPDQQELIDIIRRAAKAIQTLLDAPNATSQKKENPRTRRG
jgi:light-regulated signal transduction histidine kinase (bacteriophytochrome)